MDMFSWDPRRSSEQVGRCCSHWQLQERAVRQPRRNCLTSWSDHVSAPHRESLVRTAAHKDTSTLPVLLCLSCATLDFGRWAMPGAAQFALH